MRSNNGQDIRNSYSRSGSAINIRCFEIRGVVVRMIEPANHDDCRASAAGLDRRGAGKLAESRSGLCADRTDRFSFKKRDFGV